MTPAELRERIEAMAQGARDEMAPAAADEALGLAAKWKGYDGPYSVSWDDEGDCVVHCEDTTVARVFHVDGGHTEPLARLFASAPDDVKALAATVIAQADEITVLRRTLALSQESLAAASSGRRVTVVDEIERLQRERDEARADAAALRAAGRKMLDALRAAIGGAS
jgi:hypothetical protein